MPGWKRSRATLGVYLAREVIQNSLDARQDENKPVLVEFERLELESAAVPDLEGLRERSVSVRSTGTGTRRRKRSSNVRRKLAELPKVTGLRIGDYNTTGVLGGDKERARNWYSLIRCSGSSSKWAGEGGSFGIGKNAPFAASLMRTVLYSTFNNDDEYIFQGVASLVTHERPRVGTVQATGFLGSANGGSVRDKKKIPKRYLRTEKGTDLIILGYQADQNWGTDLIYSVLESLGRPSNPATLRSASGVRRSPRKTSRPYWSPTAATKISLLTSTTRPSRTRRRRSSPRSCRR